MTLASAAKHVTRAGRCVGSVAIFLPHSGTPLTSSWCSQSVSLPWLAVTAFEQPT
jgi:hypothetical protein